MYISMDEFNKMASTEEPAAVVTKKEGDGMFQATLGVHTLMTGLVALMSAIAYLDKKDDDTVNTLDTLLATIAVVGLANFLLSLLNFGVEMIYPSGNKKLGNRVLNSARNTMTSLTLVIGGIVFVMQTDGLTWTIIIAVGVQRLLDCMLDIGEYGTEVQCPDKDENKGSMASTSKTLVSIFGLCAFGSCVYLLLYYYLDIAGDMGDDAAIFWVVFSGVCLHTLLLMFTLGFNVTGTGIACAKMLGAKETDCDGISVHALNEIPIVSALVFTLNIGIVGLLVGEALEEDTSVKLLGAVLALLALVEIAGRRMV